jgi:hypothetical protein
VAREQVAHDVGVAFRCIERPDAAAGGPAWIRPLYASERLGRLQRSAISPPAHDRAKFGRAPLEVGRGARPIGSSAIEMSANTGIDEASRWVGAEGENGWQSEAS